MRTSIYIFAALAIFFMGFTVAQKTGGSALDEHKMTQVGIIVDDIEKAVEDWTAFLGLEEVPGINIASGHESKPTKFRGKAENASAKLAFFHMDNITIELIEPLEGKSTWREFLEEHGPGIHHVAFDVDKMKHSTELFGKHSIPEIQSGGWGTGEYAYMDATGSLGLIIELLEHYNR